MKKRIAVAVSGGVDSLCALLSLKKSGYDVFALHGNFLNSSSRISDELRKICGSLSVPFHIVDLREEFSTKVIAPFLQAWDEGLTPNPCAHCNREIKFGALLAHARRLGTDVLATGHYVTLRSHEESGRLLLTASKDKEKDQAYFLSLLPQETLDHLLFPLGQHTKAECREMLRKNGLKPPCPIESQDICFLEKGEKCVDFVRKKHLFTPAPGAGNGPIVIRMRNKGGQREEFVAGRHSGLWQYTIGQRKGLGISYSEPLYTLEKKRDTNTLVLGPRSELAMQACLLKEPNIFLPAQYWPDTLYSRLRYRQKAARVHVSREGGAILIEPEQTLFPGAEGQIATLEDGDGSILAAGVITEMRLCC